MSDVGILIMGPPISSPQSLIAESAGGMDIGDDLLGRGPVRASELFS